MIRVLLCTDSPDLRASLAETLAEQPEISIVGEAADGGEAVDLAVTLWPDVVLLDVRLPVLDGAAAAREIARLRPDARVVALTTYEEQELAAAVLEAGAVACCVEDAPLWELERAIAGASEPLVRLAHTLATSAAARGASELVARELSELTGGAGTAVYLAAPDVGLSLAAAAGPAAGTRLTGAPGVVLESFRGHRSAVAGHRELAELSAAGLACAEATAVPLLDGGEAIGVVLAASPPALGLELDRALLAAVADLAAAAVANERRLGATHAEARRDALTGLPNRRAFEERLEAHLSAATEPLGLALLDLDGFRRVNDTRGHEAGDDVLREAARVLSRRTRAREQVYRLGGDELALLVPGGREAAELVARRLLDGLRAHSRGGGLPTASGGVAASPHDGRTGAELLTAADAALSVAKAAGGDCVVAGLEPIDGDPQGPAEGAPPSARPGSRSPRAARACVAGFPRREPSRGGPQPRLGPSTPARVLVVDDDERLRLLLRTTLEVIDIEIDEAESVPAARARIARRPPDVVVLDLALPGPGGLTLCRELKENAGTRDVGVVVLTGADERSSAAAEAAGADAYLRKPFSPLDLLAVVERLAGGLYEGPFRVAESRAPAEQLLRYAEDLRRLLEIEKGQRRLIQEAYRETVGALASALEAKDTGTNAHSHRVQRYALELTWAVEPSLLEQPSLEYGFLLHDVGKIGIPDRILKKPAALTASERRVLETHSLLGEQMLSGVALLQGYGLQVVRHHHERWDGAGYPDRLRGYDIPFPARIFAVADALDAMTSDRPYRAALGWDEAFAELTAQSARQFDPAVVEAVVARAPRLREIRDSFEPDRLRRARTKPIAIPQPESGDP